MLALTDEALARFIRGAKGVPRDKRDKWLRAIARKVDPSPQLAYHHRVRNGRVKVSFECDPVDAAEFLYAAQVRVLDSSRETLALGFERLIELWCSGTLSIQFHREPL
jgi:hypothetical protein